MSLIKKKTIILDIDGVVLSWHSQIIPFLKNRKVKILKEILEAVYRGIFMDLELLNKLVPNFLMEYHKSEYGGKLYPYDPRLPSVLIELKSKYNLQFIALTSFGDDPSIKKNRHKNLKKYFPKLFDEVIMLPALACKRSSLNLLKESHDIRLFVDDSKKNYNDAIEILSLDKSFLLQNSLDWNDLFLKIDAIGQNP